MAGQQQQEVPTETAAVLQVVPTETTPVVISVTFLVTQQQHLQQTQPQQSNAHTMLAIPLNGQLIIRHKHDRFLVLSDNAPTKVQIYSKTSAQAIAITASNGMGFFGPISTRIVQ